MKNNRYYFLDGIRGIAAIFVLTRHTSNFWGVELYRSYLAVDIFFILSGFVIAHAYDEKLYSGSMSLKKFILVRLIRLYPVFILSLIFCSAILILKIVLNNSAVFIGLPEAFKMIGMTALFLPFMMEGSASLFPINGPYWSLFFELISNFIYGVIRPLLNNFILNAIIINFGIIVAATSYLNGNLDMRFHWGYMSVAAGFSRSIFGVFMGLLLYRHHEFLECLFRRFIPAWLAFTIIIIILTSPSLGRFDYVIDFFCVCIIFPVAIIAASLGKSRRLEGILLTLGSASYPIYVLHKPFGEFVSFILNKGVAGKGIASSYAPISGIMLVLTLILISVMIEKFYDIPLRRSIYNYAFNRNS